MKLYGAIDLHSNNNVLVVIDENDYLLFRKRLPNDLPGILTALAPFKPDLHGVAVLIHIQLVLACRWTDRARL